MDINTIKRRLLIKYPFFGSIIANSTFIAEEIVGTAGTDSKIIYYNPKFIESLTADEQLFIFAHEICHIAFNHIYRSEGKDRKIWNIATDAVINAFLKKDGLPLVKDVIDIPEAINYDAEEMYEKLLEEKEQKQQQNEQGNGQSKQDSEQQSSSSDENQQEQDNKSQKQSGGESGEDLHKEEQQQDVGHDTHSMWDKVIEKKHQEEESQSNQEQSNNKNDDEQSLSDKLSKNFDNKKEQQEDKKTNNKEEENKINEEIKKLAELGEKEVFKQNKIERKQQLEELKNALASQSHGAGNETSSNIISLNNIGIATPLIDWRRILKEAIKYDVDWSYENAEIENGVVTAYLEEQPRPETEIVLDTSGSINEGLLRNFLRECKNIFQNSSVKVGCFDTQFYGFTEIKDVSDIDNLRFYGGGETDFEVAVNAFSRRVENKIIFTDGEARVPKTPMDAIWIVFGKKEFYPSGGKVIYINENELNKLYSYTSKQKIKTRK